MWYNYSYKMGGKDKEKIAGKIEQKNVTKMEKIDFAFICQHHS